MSSISTAAQKPKTPDYFHVLKPPFRQSVYEPEADTFLFLDALDAVFGEPHHQGRSSSSSAGPLLRCVEIGCGSGTVIAHLAQLLLRPPTPPSSPSCGKEVNHEHGTPPSNGSSSDRALVIPTSEAAEEGNNAERPEASPTVSHTAEATCGAQQRSFEFHAVDINPLALQASDITWTKTIHHHAATTLSSPQWKLHLHCGDLFSPFCEVSSALAVGSSGCGSEGSGSSGCHSSSAPSPPPTLLFDVILFNPPYVPTSAEELAEAASSGDVIKRAWCGGPRGRVVLDRFLADLPKWLRRPGGRTLMVLIKQNDVDDVISFARQQFPPDVALSTRIVAARYTGEELCVLELCT